MDTDEFLKSFQALNIPKTHGTVGLSNLISSNKSYRSLFINRRLPDVGWSDVQIQSFLYLLSTLDTNNKGDEGQRWCGVGEREGRVFSSLVSNRHFGLSHGMGRSGDITEPQPKAVGSSVMVKLALLMVLDAIRRGSGLDAKGAASYGILLPLCTGMSMSLVLSSIREKGKDIVLWSRIDQKSCFKSISTAGLTCIIVPTKIDGCEVVTDLDAMEELLEQYKDRVLSVITTTSCFAPRVSDKVDDVAKLCARENVAHIINNAYGLQCEKTCKLINRACVVGRVDAIVCSTDKNFLVPVGGAIIISPKEDIITTIGKVYAGRASSSPIIDLFITLLSMGLRGYQQLLTERKALLPHFTTRLSEVAMKYGEKLLDCPSNTISYGISLDNLINTNKKADQTEEDYLHSIGREISYFGAMLFNRCVSGTRVVPRVQVKSMGGNEFKGFGSSTDEYPHAYMTAACAIGVTKKEVDEFFNRLDKTLKEFKKKISKKKSSS